MVFGRFSWWLGLDGLGVGSVAAGLAPMCDCAPSILKMRAACTLQLRSVLEAAVLMSLGQLLLLSVSTSLLLTLSRRLMKVASC